MSDISNIDINNVKYNLKDEVARTNSQSFVGQLSEERAARLATSVVSGEYNSSERKIELKNASGAVVSSINASAFVKDGMVSSVAVTNGNLVISFNTDAGQTPISVPLTSIFDPANYYDKTDVDNALGGKQDTINDLSTIRSGAAAGATAYQKPQGGIPATDLAPDAVGGGEFSTGEKVEDVGIDQYPQRDSSGLISSKAVAAHGSAFDISEYNKNGGTLATYETLTAALAGVPDNAKRGGMSIKYVQSSDNKYVQYRLTADSWSTSVADWENIKTARANIVAYQFEFTDGYYLSTNDTPVENTVFSYTGYIPVGNSCTVYLYNTIKAEDSAIRLLIYNTNKEKISSISLADKGIGVVTLGINNPNAAFIRLTTYTSKKDKFFVCVDYSSQLSATYQDINKYATLINISTLLPTGGNDGTDVYEPTNARNLVPTEKRKKGLLLTYKTTDGWIVEELNNDTFQTNDRYWNLLTKESLRNLVNYIGSYNSGHGLGYLDGEGKFVGNSFNYTEMAYIPVDEGTPIYFATGTTSSRSSICFYTDKNEASFLSAIAGDGTSNPRFAIVPSGAKYIRYSYASSVKDTFIFKMGITALSAKSDSGEDAIVAEIKGSYVDTDNTYFGYGAMANKSGDNCDFNAAFGVDALKEVKNDGNVLDTGRYNAAFGHSALKKNTTGNHNTAVGYGAGNNITTGVGNTAIGEDAMNSCGGSAEANTAVGRYSLFKVSSSHNIGIGTNAGYDVSSGTYNILLGENAGYFSGSANNVTTDTYSVFIGDRAGKSVSTPLTNAIAIGSGAKVDASNAIRLGNSSITKVETYGDLSCLRDGGGIILKSPNGTPYKITVSNSGELVVTAVS